MKLKPNLSLKTLLFCGTSLLFITGQILFAQFEPATSAAQRASLQVSNAEITQFLHVFPASPENCHRDVSAFLTVLEKNQFEVEAAILDICKSQAPAQGSALAERAASNLSTMKLALFERIAKLIREQKMKRPELTFGQAYESAYNVHHREVNEMINQTYFQNDKIEREARSRE